MIFVQELQKLNSGSDKMIHPGATDRGFAVGLHEASRLLQLAGKIVYNEKHITSN